MFYMSLLHLVRRSRLPLLFPLAGNRRRHGGEPEKKQAGYDRQADEQAAFNERARRKSKREAGYARY